MKSASFTVEDAAMGAAISAEQGTGAIAGGLLAQLRGAFAVVQAAYADRMLRAELAELDDHVLRDLGIADDELCRVHARENFTPRAWRA